MLEIRCLTAGFGGEPVLNRLDLTVAGGERIAVLGPSGIGKTTLLRCIKGLMRGTGTVAWKGEAVEKAGSRIALVYQDLRLLPWFTASVNIELPLKIAGVSGVERRDRCRRQLAQVGLSEMGGRYPKELSGGERQRIALARTLITDPELLLLDEPFSSLDEMNRESLQSLLLDRVIGEGLTMLMVTHSVAEAVFMAGKIILIDPHRKPEILQTTPRRDLHSRTEESFLADQAEVRRRLEAYYAA